MSDRLPREEYTSLSEQKADDWRSISEVNPALFGVAGAIFAAGVAEQQPEVVALSPLPLYLGVWHMVRHARLQLQMVTYLAVYAPADTSWEHDIDLVRPRFWDRTRGKRSAWRAELTRPSAWNTWLVITCALSIVAILIPVFGDYANWCNAVWAGLPMATVATGVIFWQTRRIQPDRELWSELWREYQAETTAKNSAEQA